MTTIPHAHTRATHTRNAALAVTIVAGVLLALATAFFALWLVSDVFTPEWIVEVPVASPRDVVPLVAGAAAESHTYAYGTVLISSYAALVVPRTLAAIAMALNFAVALVTLVMVIVLAARVRIQRSFTRAATVGIVVLGALSTVTAFAAPWLERLSITTTVSGLGYPTSGDEAPAGEWVVPPQFTLQDANWPLLFIGILFLLTAALFVRARRLQRDTEGLV